MPIKNSQLEIWSNQGATVTPKALREKIENVLTNEKSLITNKNSVSIFLQGSYRNSTNIYGNSDVDIVVQTNNVFYSDTSSLNQFKKELYESQKTTSQYTWNIYKTEVIDTLRNYFGEDSIEIGNKSIKIDTGSYEADVIPCIQFKKYLDYGNSEQDKVYVEGMKFFTANENREVINFPKRHYSFGVEKNKQTEGMYKKTVRVFKNMKKEMVIAGNISKEEAPSYFVENLIYNVPNDKFTIDNFSLTVLEILVWLNENKVNLSSFVCQNEMLPLFGTTPEQWNEKDARKFLSELISFWNAWDK